MILIQIPCQFELRVKIFDEILDTPTQSLSEIEGFTQLKGVVKTVNYVHS